VGAAGRDARGPREGRSTAIGRKLNKNRMLQAGSSFGVRSSIADFCCESPKLMATG